MTQPRIPLARLLVTAHAGEKPVARDPGREKLRTFGELERAVGSLVGRIGHHPPGRWLVHTQGAFEMAAALLSLWQSGSWALLAPNAQPDTLAALAGEGLGVIGDDASLADVVDVVLVDDGSSSELPVWREVGASERAVELLTSGTTSARKLIPKTLGQLDAELEAQERCFGRDLGPAEIVSTVSHQHLYGLLFHVLWPLSAGRVFHAGPCLLPSEVGSRATAAPDGAVVVSAPVHLERLASHRDLARWAPNVREVFSSGGPLDPTSADALADALGRAPVEIYGSTETGGIAWRRQTRAAGDERLAWTPLPEVTLQRDDARGTLRVRSPFALASLREDVWVETADRVAWVGDGRFLLQGRADRTAKVGEKSVSLPDLEEDLRRHPAVGDVACLRVDRRPGPRIGAVVVLSAEGHTLLADGGRPAVGSALSKHLARSWERVLLPRIWRYVEALPRDPLGKIPAAALEEILGGSADVERPTAPELLEERTGPDHHERLVRIPEDLAHFRGHFPDHPVVPGVAQIGWVLEIVRGPLGEPTAPVRIDALKFNHVIRPGDRVRIRVDRKDGGRKFVFQLSSESQAFSSGRVVLGREA